jgi:hypothetical protein
VARDLNGTTQYMTTAAQYPRVNGTISMWIRPDWSTGDSAHRMLFETWDGGSNVFHVEYYTDNNWYWGWITAGGDFRITVSAATMPLTAGNWYHVAYRWDDTTNASAVFLNGVSKGTGSALETANMSGFNFRIGAASDGSLPHDGRMGTVALWSESLSDAAILALAGGIQPLCVNPHTLLDEWLMMGRASPEPSTLGVNSLTLTGTPVYADHHPLAFRRSVPSRPAFVSVAAAANAGVFASIGFS